MLFTAVIIELPSEANIPGRFFASIPMPNPDAVGQELEKENIFLVPLAKGLRVSVASIPEDKIVMVPERIKAAMERLADK